MRKRHFFLGLLFLALATSLPVAACAEQRSLTLGVKTSDWPPYLIPSNPQKPGLIVEVCRLISRQLQIPLNLRQLPDQRGLLLLAEGEIDVWPKALEWLDELDLKRQHYYWSDPLVEVADIVVSLKDHPVTLTRPQQLRQKRIGTILGYGYPFLHDHFVRHPEARIDLTDERKLLEVLQRKRVDAVVINRLVFFWLIKEQQLDIEQFHIHPQPFDPVGYRLIFSRRTVSKELVERFNTELDRLRRSGQLQRVLSRYGVGP